MKLEDQVCSLELAKKLKELGVPQESLFYWLEYNDGFSEVIFTPNDPQSAMMGFSAFTSAELGELLPQGYYSLQSKEGGWACFPTSKRPFESTGFLVQATWGNTEVNARAKMICYLLENGLLTQPEKGSDK